jgi:two-component system, chemotaxis family, chemotaxis protein CheY
MKKVLIIEDDKATQRALAIRLTSAGYQVASAYDAVIAMSMVRSEQPDMILLDVSIPGGDGFKVAERIRGIPALVNIPFIFLTGTKKPGFQERAQELGAAGFLEKPFDPEALLNTMASALYPKPG